MRLLLEALMMAAAGLLLGLAGNALHPRGLRLGHDYFPPAPGVPPVVAEAGGEGVPPAVAARLAERGLTPLGFDEARALFEDPLTAMGAYVFVDARKDEPYQAGHIPGAWQLDHYQMERYLEPVLGAVQGALRVIVYCTGGDCEDSEFAAVHLTAFGVDQSLLSVYVGGYEEWRARGMPLETGVRP